MKKSQLRHIIREVIKEQVKKTATMQPKKFEKKPMSSQNPPATRGFTNPLPPKGGGGVKLDLPKGPGHTPGPGDACYNAVGMVCNTPGGILIVVLIQCYGVNLLSIIIWESL